MIQDVKKEIKINDNSEICRNNFIHYDKIYQIFLAFPFHIFEDI